MIIEFYTRKRCPLCEKGKAILTELQESLRFEIIEKDIDTNDEWNEQYGLMIPVVVLDGEEVQYGQLDKMFINEALTKKIHRI
ncbi:glutaredoxin family protein [Robertmurraya korlensis]|uniref:glutaredoxin family protein n=1 Tax=Robertmurraya korlensis TaxID=519977 RepID=UPI00203A6B54|nr:glutaredoxin family protein [Robertmurraya korlensis]MCM3602498.1 glutaredoxin family protein [Robertmurraya korlensis]